MNLLEHYVTNITREYETDFQGVKMRELICDIDCYGNVKKQEHILLLEEDYKMIQEKGYYLA